MKDLWLARISSLSNEVGLYVVLPEVLLFMPNSLIIIIKCTSEICDKYLTINSIYSCKENMLTVSVINWEVENYCPSSFLSFGSLKVIELTYPKVVRYHKWVERVTRN